MRRISIELFEDIRIEGLKCWFFASVSFEFARNTSGCPHFEKYFFEKRSLFEDSKWLKLLGFLIFLFFVFFFFLAFEIMSFRNRILYVSIWRKNFNFSQQSHRNPVWLCTCEWFPWKFDVYPIDSAAMYHS